MARWLALKYSPPIYATICVFGAAGEEVSGDEIIDSPFLSCKICAICRFNGMYGCVGLIVLVSYFRFHVFSLFQQSVNVLCVWGAALESLYQLRKMHCCWKCVGLGSWVTDVAVHV